MLPFSNNPHLIAGLARERYNDLRREADAWRLGHERQGAAETECVPSASRLQSALITLRLRLSRTPRAEIVPCP